MCSANRDPDGILLKFLLVLYKYQISVDEIRFEIAVLPARCCERLASMEPASNAFIDQ